MPFGHQKLFFLIPGGNDLDEQVKLQQAMLRRQELLDKIRVSEFRFHRLYTTFILKTQINQLINKQIL